MGLRDQLRGLDDRVLRDRATVERQRWVRRWGWLMLLGLALTFAVAGSILAAVGLTPVAAGAAFVVAGAYCVAAALVRRRRAG